MSYVGQINAGGVTSPIASTLFGVCDTAANVATKVVNCPDLDQLVRGTTLHVFFYNGNTASVPKLKINDLTVVNILGSDADIYWQDSITLSLTFNGLQWVINSSGNGGLAKMETGTISQNDSKNIEVYRFATLIICYDASNSGIYGLFLATINPGSTGMVYTIFTANDTRITTSACNPSVQPNSITIRNNGGTSGSPPLNYVVYKFL